jgi:hypothetical protein
MRIGAYSRAGRFGAIDRIMQNVHELEAVNKAVLHSVWSWSRSNDKDEQRACSFIHESIYEGQSNVSLRRATFERWGVGPDINKSWSQL